MGESFLQGKDLIINCISQCGMTFFIHMFTVSNTWSSKIRCV